MKRTLLNTALVALLILLPTAAMGYDFEVDGICYKINDDNATVSVTNKTIYYHDYSGNVAIPSTVSYGDNTYSVTAIGDYAFMDCSGLIDISIPETVSSIGFYAFGNCVSLTSMELPNSVTVIDDYAFYCCKGLPEIIFPDSLATIGHFAFEYCTGLTHITVPNAVTSIGGSAFEGCTALTSVTLGNSVADIGDHAFRDCIKLTSIIIPEPVTGMGYGAFDGCTGIKTLTYNAINCETPPDYSLWIFSDCPLDTIIFGDKVQHIPHYLLAEQHQLKSVTIPNSVTSIGNNAFQRCSRLINVTIGWGVTSIGNLVFGGCSQLRDVICLAAVPPSMDGEFFNDRNYYTQAVLHTLPDALEAYQSAPYWDNFSQILGDVTIYIPGDVNGDGEVTIADANTAIDVIINGGSASHGHNRAPADTNEDGEVTIADINTIIDIILNNH